MNDSDVASESSGRSSAPVRGPPSAGITEAQSMDELEQSLATRPRRKLTPEEKVARRRLQYKLHQRRHRAKELAKELEMEKTLCELAETVACLDDKRRTLLANGNVFQSRSLTTGRPASVAMEYVRHFGHGYSLHKEQQQEAFLRSVMVEDVGGPDYEGVSQLMQQCRLYGAFFVKTECVPRGIEVATMGDLTAVVLVVVLTVHPRREGVVGLYPNLVGNESTIQDLVGTACRVPGKLRLLFNAAGECSWFGTDLDFVVGLHEALGSLGKVAACMRNSNISFCTGQIALMTSPPTPLEYRNTTTL